MKKKVLSVVLACAMVFSLAACGNTSGGSANAPAGTDSNGSDAAPSGDAVASELTDGKFADTRHITVEVYDRNNDGGSDPTNNVYTEYIKKGMLEKHNVEVEFVAIPRWTETDEINTQLAAGTAPDVCVTYSYPTIKAYADMDAIIDMRPYIDNYKDELPNLWNWLGETNLYWNSDLNDGTTWAIEAKLANMNRVITFIRKDWLDKLGLKEPTTKQEFHDVLVAFKENADTLLGSDASKIIPYSVSYDVGWRAGTLIESFLDPNMSDKEYYVNGFDDRKLTQNGTKEGVKLLNEWYNEGLMWKDFYLYSSGDTTEDDMMKAGYVGAFTHNWDYPWRNGDDSIAANLKRLVGDDAKYIAIDPFEDKNGGHNKFLAGPIDRKIFFPATNDEPLASMLYLDFISDSANVEYLQIGDEGITHTKDANGIVFMQTADDDHAGARPNSGYNIDLTMTTNGLRLSSDDLTIKSMAYSYANVDPEDVVNAINVSLHDAKYPTSIDLGTIDAEVGIGDSLTGIQRSTFDKAVAAPEADFDSVWDSGMADYLAAGGQAIIDERLATWEAAYGSSTMIPE